MAKSNLGKRVSSVGSQGGGKTYKKTRPANFYGALAVIVILGLALTAYSRYEYQNPAKRSTTTTIAPGIGRSSTPPSRFRTAARPCPHCCPMRPTRAADSSSVPTT